MAFVESKLLKKSGWVCSGHVSANADIQTIRATSEKPVFVELFSGSGGVSEVARKEGFQTVTIDIEEKYEPDICTDIMNLRRSALPRSVDVVWCSIPCTVYSILNLVNHWDKISIGFRQYYYVPKTKEALQALRILNKTIRLVNRLKPMYYFYENPRGALRHFPQMVNMPCRKTISYADYGFDYYKPTDIFSNCQNFNPIKIQGSAGKTFDVKIADLSNAYERSKVPPMLIKEVLASTKITPLVRAFGTMAT